MQRIFDKVLVTGGAGYCGARLVPQLLSRGYKVTVFDIMFFGNQFLPRDNPNLRIVDGDIRDTAKFAATVAGHDAVVNLACISNDASFELDEDLSTSINLNAFEPMVVAAKKAGVKRFVYASSSSVYGVSDKPDVTEDHPLVPLTLYNKYKGLCEPLLFKHQAPGFTCVTIRPATICGYAARPLGQHPDQPRGQFGQDHRLRRGAAAAEPPHSGHGRRLPAHDRSAGR